MRLTIAVFGAVTMSPVWGCSSSSGSSGGSGNMSDGGQEVLCTATCPGGQTCNGGKCTGAVDGRFYCAYQANGQLLGCYEGITQPACPTMPNETTTQGPGPCPPGTAGGCCGTYLNGLLIEAECLYGDPNGLFRAKCATTTANGVTMMWSQTPP